MSNITLCRFWVKAEREDAFKVLLENHWPTFQKLDLVNDAVPHLVFRGEDKERGVFYVETFPWKDEDAMKRAHSLPEVAAIWEPMADCCSTMEFPSVSKLDL